MEAARKPHRRAGSPKALRLVEVRCVLCGSDDAEVAASGWDFEYHTVPDEFRFVRCRR